MTITTDLILAFCGGSLLVITLIYLLVDRMLLPYIREHLTVPMATVCDHVANDHKTNLRDDIDSVDSKVDGLDAKVDQLVVAVERLSVTLDLTREGESQDRRDLWSAVNELRRRP